MRSLEEVHHELCGLLGDTDQVTSGVVEEQCGDRLIGVVVVDLVLVDVLSEVTIRRDTVDGILCR